MRIQTERLLLKEITENDFSSLFDLMTNEEVKKTYLVPDFENETAFMKTFSHLKKLSKDENGHTAGIFLGEELIGLFHKVDITNDRVEVGYAVHPRHKNRGYATEALQAGIRYFFEKGFSEVCAGAFKTNLASLKVMEKAGMRKTKMKASVTYRGEVHPCVYYSIKR
jgi:RimJ/RimL family protein N-acetyltransferase